MIFLWKSTLYWTMVKVNLKQNRRAWSAQTATYLLSTLQHSKLMSISIARRGIRRKNNFIWEIIINPGFDFSSFPLIFFILILYQVHLWYYNITKYFWAYQIMQVLCVLQGSNNWSSFVIVILIQLLCMC